MQKELAEAKSMRTKAQEELALAKRDVEKQVCDYMPLYHTLIYISLSSHCHCTQIAVQVEKRLDRVFAIARETAAARASPEASRRVSPEPESRHATLPILKRTPDGLALLSSVAAMAPVPASADGGRAAASARAPPSAAASTGGGGAAAGSAVQAQLPGAYILCATVIFAFLFTLTQRIAIYRGTSRQVVGLVQLSEYSVLYGCCGH
jgi:hypothetical protein